MIGNVIRRKRIIKYSLLSLFFSLLVVAGISLSNFGDGISLGLHGESQEYSLTLDNNNKVTSNGNVNQYSKLGGKVTFTYSNVANSTTGHVTLNNDGTVVNKSIIHSITSFKVNFTGSLKARIGYVNNNWGEYFNIVSDKEYETGTYPYFIELKATANNTVINNAIYRYSCQVNAAAEIEETADSYDITFKANGSDDSAELTNVNCSNEIETGANFISSFSDLTKVYPGASGLKFGSKSNAGGLTINFDSSKVTEKISTIDVATAQYGSDTGNFKFYLNGSSSYTSITPSSGGTIEVNDNLASLEIETTTKRAYLCGLTLNYGVTPDSPVNPTKYVTGFSATDANKNEYTTNSIFDSDNALSVTKLYSDSSSISLSKDEYSYKITNSSGVEIDTSIKFPLIDTYTLSVYYKDYDPVIITLNVGEYVYMTDVAASMTKVTFTTAESLSNNLAGNLTATIEYSNDSMSESISYSDFADNDLGVHLITPKGFTYDQSKPFGTAGNWTVKVYDVTNQEMYYNISITVNAIPVEQISLNAETYTMYIEDTLQLVASINPNTATNQLVNWSSNNEEVATVSEDGLVTAIGVGGATITATAVDGSNVYGSCVITVLAAPALVSDTLTRETTGVESSTTYTDWSNKTGTSGAVYAGQSAGSNNTIQLRSSNSNSGIITTTSGGKISKVSVDWYSGTSTGRILNIYGKDTAYSDPTDLYDDNAGELLGTIEYGEGTELSISGNYKFVGVRSSSGALYLNSITFTWGNSSATPVAPVYPTSISISGSSSITIGDVTELSVNYTPNDTNVKNVSWTSSNDSIATVSNDGLVTGIAQGNVTITANAEAKTGTVTATKNITVNPISVTSVSLNSSSETVKEGKTVTLVATIYPTNATNKNVTWSSSDSSVATVSQAGVVTGVSAGTTTITVASNDGNKKATCVITVTSASAASEETFSITYTDLPASYSTASTIYTASSGIKFQAYNCAGGYSSKMQFRASTGYLQSTEELVLQSLTINDRESNSLTVYGSNTAGSFTNTISGNNDVYDLSGYSYFKIARESSGAGYCSSITIRTGVPTPTDPTNIILSPTSVELAPNGTKQLSVSYVPSNANQNKQITWTSSNTSVATVNSEGLISVKSTASAGQSATITAKLTNIPSITATCNVSVVEKQIDDHTVLVYMCGADLESENQLATGDIQEILRVSNQPSDVNIVIETGGANSWAKTYGISSTNLERWHVENKQLVKDDSLTYASMGSSSTLQQFIEYGLSNYPAQRTGLILWNHGGGMRGVCYDEKKNDDVLKNSEVRSATSGALSNANMSGQKLEWIGYDACLMAVQDIAETNSQYFNYMVASEESEAGYGWDYDTWVDDLYAKKPTETILKAIVDGFIADNGGASSSGDQTLSYLDLSYAGAYKTAWEAMATQLYSKVTSSNRSSFNSAITGNVKHYADSDYDYFCTFDAWDFVDKLANNSAFNSFKIDSSYITAIKNAHANLVKYNLAQKGAGVSKGLCMYWVNSTQYSDVSTYYTTSETNFTQWRKLNIDRGYHA